MIRYTGGKEIGMWYPSHVVSEPQKLDYATRGRVLSVIEEAQRVACEESLKRLFRGQVNKLIPHQMAACGIGERGKQSQVSYINISFPEEYLRSVIINNRITISPVVDIWAEYPIALAINDLTTMKIQNPDWSKVVDRHGIRNMLVNGLPGIAGDNSSYFCLAQCPEPITEKHRYLMELITPHLHAALLRVFNAKRVTQQGANLLTGREREVLCALCRGHTNKEIASELRISGNTARNHVYRICEKLGVTNRTEAVAKANQLKKW